MLKDDDIKLNTRLNAAFRGFTSPSLSLKDSKKSCARSRHVGSRPDGVVRAGLNSSEERPCRSNSLLSKQILPGCTET